MLKSSVGRLLAAVASGLLPVLVGCTNLDLSTAPMTDYPQLYLDARQALLVAAETGSDVTRIQAIEAMAEVLGDHEADVFLQALADKNPAIRFAAAMAVGDVRHSPARGHLLRMAADKTLEPNRFVFCAVIYALYQLSNTEYTAHLGELLFDREEEVRSSAVLAMGKMGEPSAIGPLNKLYAQEQDPTVRLRVVEAMALLGDSRSANMLEAYTKSQFMDERVDAIGAMARAPGSRSVFVLSQLLSSRQPPFVRVAAAGALAQLGEFPPEAYELTVAAVRDPAGVLGEHMGQTAPNDVQIDSLQQLAARSLGWMDQPGAADVLAPLLSSAAGGVRVAAAASILKLLAAYEQFPPPQETATVELPQAPTTAEAPEPPTQPAKPMWKPRPEARKLYRAGGKD